MADASFKGAGYTGITHVLHINRFTFGPMPPRARLFDPDAQKKHCTEFHAAARKFLVSQDYLNEGPGVQELIPEIELTPAQAKKPMEVLVWFTGFAIQAGDVVFEVELRTSEKLPTKARKIIGDTLSRAFKACVGNIERSGGIPGDLVPAETLVTPKEPDTPPAPNNEIPVTP